MTKKFTQGIYRLKNPNKYKDYRNLQTIHNPKIIYRSSWERRVMNYLDMSPNVIAWSSEEVVVPYFSTVDNSTHRYFPDFWVMTLDEKTKKVTQTLIEVKPHRDLLPPPKNTKKSLIQERMKVYLTNKCKFEAAKLFCEHKGWVFKILTEKQLFK